MKAAVLKDKGVLAIEDMPEPKALPGEVVVKVAYCGICGSDLSFYKSDTTPRGLVMGHEWSGTIVEVGKGVEDWRTGDRVVAFYGRPCGSCLYCQHGLFKACSYWLERGVPTIARPGAFTEYVTQPTARLFRVPDEITDEEAATMEPLIVGLHAVRESSMRVGDSVVVLGGGPIGLFTMQCAKDAGAHPIILTEMNRDRAKLAEMLGADIVLDPSLTDINAEVTKRLPVGSDVVFECVGVGSTLQQSADLVRRFGRVVLVGLFREPVTVNPNGWIRKNVSLATSCASTIEDYQIAVDLLREKRVNVSAMITTVISLSEIQPCFQSLIRPSSQIKVLVRPV